jgi:hypothetical protein
MQKMGNEGLHRFGAEAIYFFFMIGYTFGVAGKGGVRILFVETRKRVRRRVSSRDQPTNHPSNPPTNQPVKTKLSAQVGAKNLPKRRQVRKPFFRPNLRNAQRVSGEVTHRVLPENLALAALCTHGFRSQRLFEFRRHRWTSTQYKRRQK